MEEHLEEHLEESFGEKTGKKIRKGGSGMGRFGQRMASFFYGRYGNDAFNLFLSVFAMVLLIANCIVGWFVYLPILSWSLYGVALLLVGWSFFRTFSRNIAGRQRENLRFLSLFRRFTVPFRRLKVRIRDRKTHVFRKCPQCKKTLRLPRVAGDHFVNCPVCHTHFAVHVGGKA